jgi:hypothetical protein
LAKVKAMAAVIRTAEARLRDSSVVAVAVEIAAEVVEIVVEAVAVRKAEGDGPAPGLVRSGANAM